MDKTLGEKITLKSTAMKGCLCKKVGWEKIPAHLCQKISTEIRARLQTILIGNYYNSTRTFLEEKRRK